MILGFREQFVPFILNGSKTHTIRAGARWEAGMRGDLYRNVRQASQTLLFRAPIYDVETIFIVRRRRRGKPYRTIKISGHLLTARELDALAWRDGFRHAHAPHTFDGCFKMMNRFWDEQYPLIDYFAGQILHWDYFARWEGPIDRETTL